MGAKTIAATAAVAALAGWAIWRGRNVPEDGAARRGQDVAAAAAAAPAGASALPPDAAPATEASARREALDPAAMATTATSEVLLYGSVVDPEGEPVELEALELEDEGARARDASSTMGSYAIGGLAPGRYTLSAEARGFLTRREGFVLPASAEHCRHDLVLEPALSIPVRLLDENGTLIAEEPRSGRLALDVVATPTAPTGSLCGLCREPGPVYGCGEFARADVFHLVRELPVGYSGLLRLRVAPPVYVSVVLLDATLATRRVDGPVSELVFTLERAAIEQRLGGIRARFVDALTGRPISDGKAALDPPSMSSAGGDPTDSDGSATFPARAPGLYELRFFHDGHERVSRHVRVSSGRVDDLGEVPVWPAAKLRGRVLDARGEPVSACLFALPRDRVRGPADLDPADARGVTGWFELDAVARAPLELFVQVPGHALMVRAVDATSGLVEGLGLRVDEGVPVVLRAPDEPVGGQLTIADERGVPLETHMLLETRCVATRVVPGRYQVWLGRAEEVFSKHELVVGSERVDLVVGSGGR